MRLAIISDVHGNLPALEAVLADIAGRHVDGILNLGDCVSGQIDPAGTAARLMGLGAPTVRGNHDRHVVERADKKLGAADRFARERLDADQIAWLAGLPATHLVEGEVLMCHGTPAADNEHLLETLSGTVPVQRRHDDIVKRLGEGRHAVTLCGHSHRPRVLRLKDGRLVMNPGSVGWPSYSDHQGGAVGVGSPHARYGILTRRGGLWDAELIAVDYDHMPVSRLAMAAGNVELGQALATGWVD